MTKLFLDDLREPPDGSWIVVRSYEEFIRYIEANGVPDLISFDHDLSFEHYPSDSDNPLTEKIPYDIYKEKTGYHCAKWLTEQGLEIKDFKVHSANFAGAENIRALLNSWKRHCEVGLGKPRRL